jgi:hypothetical protein
MQACMGFPRYSGRATYLAHEAAAVNQLTAVEREDKLTEQISSTGC